MLYLNKLRKYREERWQMYDDSNEKETLASEYPHIAREWHTVRNGKLRPQDVSPKSGQKVWWICGKGHEWQAVIYHRTYNKSGCPYCARKKVIVGVNDLETTNPELISEWHPIKNGQLTPRDVMAGSDKRIWWVCSQGHEYEALIKSRAKMKSGCPYCSGRKAIVGVNDLATTNSELISEWYSIKNGNITPRDVKAGSNKVVWWRCCKCGYTWQTPIVYRAIRGQGCPNCSPSNKRSLQEVATDSTDVISWKCDKGYEWNTSATNRAKCPVCIQSKKRVIGRSLQEVCSDLAIEWDYEKNGSLTPKDVLPKSGKKVWWKCTKGHVWQATIYSRTAGNGCPLCSGRKAIKGKNDLLTLRPDIAKLWHPSRNADLTAEQVTTGSGKKVWWQGKCGHEWLEKVITMTTRKNHIELCPQCRQKERQHK